MADRGSKEKQMSEVAMMFPVRLGKRDALIAFAEALSGERSAEYDAAQTSVEWENWFLQPTPMGDFCIMTMAAPDPAAVFAGLAASDGPFDAWFRGQVLEITGVDLSVPPPGLPQQIFAWKSPATR